MGNRVLRLNAIYFTLCVTLHEKTLLVPQQAFEWSEKYKKWKEEVSMAGSA